eukprot:EW706083.1.p1 GENE.EW706083.1~~EW706083.1.p1  ORF type:complete len:148 (+),score=15.57 EW706083.1:177-620(+)
MACVCSVRFRRPLPRAGLPICPFVRLSVPFAFEFDPNSIRIPFQFDRFPLSNAHETRNPKLKAVKTATPKRAAPNPNCSRSEHPNPNPNPSAQTFASTTSFRCASAQPLRVVCYAVVTFRHVCMNERRVSACSRVRVFACPRVRVSA